jgi:hypothetical protein
MLWGLGWWSLNLGEKGRKPPCSPEEALSYVGRTRARSAQIGGCDGIAQRFQVMHSSGEPFTSKAARNLLSKDNWRFSERHEIAHGGPEVGGGVGEPGAFADATEGLAGAATRPDWRVVGPACKTKGVGPAANPGEEVDGWREGSDAVGEEAVDVSLNDAPGRDEVAGAKLTQPSAGEGVVVAVEDGGVGRGVVCGDGSVNDGCGSAAGGGTGSGAKVLFGGGRHVSSGGCMVVRKKR